MYLVLSTNPKSTLSLHELLTETKTTVHTADGTELRIKGKIKAKMKLGKFSLEQDLIVSKIDD
jgi:uncharacterized protein (UPF0216 family)